jgi:BCL2/adenovirus E1B protein-interacting protein 2
MVYFHSNITESNKPSLTWCRETYKALTRKYKKNVQHLYIVHPTFWTKAVFWFLTPFLSEKFFRKLVYVERVRDLYSCAPQMKIPDSIFAFDRSYNLAKGRSSEQEGAVAAQAQL